MPLQPPVPSPSRPSLRVVYVLSLLLSACSLLYELLIAQTLATIVGNIVICYSLTVGIYLAAMGAGAMLWGARLRDEVRPWHQLFRIEILLTMVGALVVLFLYGAQSVHLFQAANSADNVTTVSMFGIAFSATFTIGLLTGMELPLLIHLGRSASGGRTIVNRVLGWDYIGALGGGVIFPVALAPYFELHAIGFGVASLNLVAALFVHLCFLRHEHGSEGRTRVLATLGMLLIAAIGLAPHIGQYILKKYYFYIESSDSVATLVDPMDHMPRIERAKSPYQSIDIVHDPDPRRYDDLYDDYSTKFAQHPAKPKNRYLFLNREFQTSSNNEEIYHEWFAHVPIIARGKVPRRVLVMGAGDGLLHRELVKYPEIQSIVHVDIDPRLVEMAMHHPVLTALNEHALEDPRVHTVFSDAFQYIRNVKDEMFDAVYLDFPPAENYNLSRLYSREFYHFVHEHLADGGFVALDTPGLYLNFNRDEFGRPRLRHDGSWETHSSTMRQAGFGTVLPFYSIFEVDNVAAYRTIIQSEAFRNASTGENAKLDSDEAKQMWLERRLSEFTSSLRQGFILLRKEPTLGPFDYVDFGIPMHVMNERRFGLAFPILADPPAIVVARVNSIMRPTLPRPGFGKIRAPW